MSKIMILRFDDPEDRMIHTILDLLEERSLDVTIAEPVLVMSFQGLEIRIAEKRVLLDENDVRLSRTEFAVLSYLAKHSSWVLSRRQIYNAVWPPDAETELHSVEAAISSLRKKIDPELNKPRFIETMPGHGYRFIGKVISK